MNAPAQGGFAAAKGLKPLLVGRPFMAFAAEGPVPGHSCPGCHPLAGDLQH
jgi:hypothetical protein